MNLSLYMPMVPLPLLGGSLDKKFTARQSESDICLQKNIDRESRGEGYNKNEVKYCDILKARVQLRFSLQVLVNSIVSQFYTLTILYLSFTQQIFILVLLNNFTM